MHVLGVLDQCRPAVFLQGLPTVHGTSAHADRGVPPLATGLRDAVEPLLHSTRTALQPAHVRAPGAEVLRCLQETQALVVSPALVAPEVGHHVHQHHVRWHEVRVKDDDELTRVVFIAVSQTVVQVARLLLGTPEVQGVRFGPSRATEVDEAQICRLLLEERLVLAIGAVVEDIDLHDTGIGELLDVAPGVEDHLDRLAADRQKDVDAGRRHPMTKFHPLPPVAHQLDMTIVVEVLRPDCHHQADDVVEDREGGQGQEDEQRRMTQPEQNLRDGDTRKGHHRQRRQPP